MEVKEKLKETGQRFSDAASDFKDKIVAKLSEENAQTPEQRLKNARAEEAGAKEVEKAAKRALLGVQAEADKYKRYAESAEAKGDMAGVQKFENALQDILEKLKPLEADYQEATAKTQALGEICNELEAALTAQPEEVSPTPPAEPVAEPISEIQQQPELRPEIPQDVPESIPMEFSLGGEENG